MTENDFDKMWGGRFFAAGPDAIMEANHRLDLV